MVEVVNCCNEGRTDEITGDFINKIFEQKRTPYSPQNIPDYDVMRDF